MSRFLAQLTGISNATYPNDPCGTDEYESDDDEYFQQYMEEEFPVEFIEDVSYESINKHINYNIPLQTSASKVSCQASLGCKSNSSSKTTTLLSSFEKKKVKKRRKQQKKLAPLKTTIVMESTSSALVSPTRNSPSTLPTSPTSSFPNNSFYEPVNFYERSSIGRTPSGYPSNLTHVSACESLQWVYIFGSSVNNGQVSTYLLTFENKITPTSAISLKQQHLDRFPKITLPSFDKDSRLFVWERTYSTYLFIHSKGCYYYAQVKNGTLVSAFERGETAESDYIEGDSWCLENSSFWRFGGKNTETNELTNELFQYTILDCKQLTINKIECKNAPSPRRCHSMCFDISHNRMYIFGGINEEGNLLNDLHCLDLSKRVWSRVKTSIQLNPMRNACMFYSTDSGSIILMGGVLSDECSVNPLIVSVNERTGSVAITKVNAPQVFDILQTGYLFGASSIIVLGRKREKKFLSKVISRMVEDTSTHDVSFETRNGKRVSALKCVLSTRSKFFEKLFETQQDVYSLTDLKEESLLFYINFLYTGETNTTNLPKPIDSKLISMLEFDNNIALKKYITDQSIFVSDFYHFKHSLEDDMSQLYSRALNSKDQDKSTMNSSSLICFQLEEDNKNTHHYFIEKVFACRIEFFKIIINSGMIEAKNREIHLEISSDCMEWLIGYMYNGLSETISDNILFELFIISKQLFHSTELIEFCEKNIGRAIHMLSPEIAIHILNFFENTCHGCHDLVVRCRNHVLSNFEESRSHLFNLDTDLRVDLNQQYLCHLKRQFKRKLH